MKNAILFAFITGLFVSSAFPQDENGKVPLDLLRFVKTADKAVTEKPVEPPMIDTHIRPNKRVADSKSSTEVTIDFSRQFLTNGRGTWDEASLGVVHKFSTRKVLYATYSETKRFDERDRQAMVGYYHPIDKKWTLLVEAIASPTHRVLAKWSALAQVERTVGKGLIAHAGFRRTELVSAKLNVAKLGVDKYWGNNRAAYSLSVNNLEDTGTFSSHRIQYNRYYGSEISSVGVSFVFGEEVERVGGGNILKSGIRNVTVSGKHAFNRRWAVAYGYTHHKQGDVYSRRGLKLGLRFKF